MKKSPLSVTTNTPRLEVLLSYVVVMEKPHTRREFKIIMSQNFECFHGKIMRERDSISSLGGAGLFAPG
jgi:hypothetical protein